MEKVKLTSIQHKNVAIFLRFLKEHSLYEMFKKDFHDYKKGFSFLKLIKHSRIILGNFITDTIMFYNNLSSERWIEPDNKWKIYLYNNKIYGTSYTISKKKLLSDIKDIIVVFDECEETVNEAKRICDIEHINYHNNVN